MDASLQNMEARHTAEELIGVSGDDAPETAARIADACIARGDLSGFRQWMKVLRLVTAARRIAPRA